MSIMHIEGSKQVPGRASLLATLLSVGIAAGSLVASTSAHAQAEGGRGKRGAEMQQRFKAADTNNDGKLSKDEAKAGMPMVYEHFDEIDTAKSGAITMADLITYLKAQRAKKGG